MAYQVFMTSALLIAPAGHQPVGRRHSIHRDSAYALLLERVPGLAIIKGLVEAHGGRIRVESGDGSGSRFLAGCITMARPR